MPSEVEHVNAMLGFTITTIRIGVGFVQVAVKQLKHETRFYKTGWRHQVAEVCGPTRIWKELVAGYQQSKTES